MSYQRSKNMKVKNTFKIVKEKERFEVKIDKDSCRIYTNKGLEHFITLQSDYSIFVKIFEDCKFNYKFNVIEGEIYKSQSNFFSTLFHQALFYLGERDRFYHSRCLLFHAEIRINLALDFFLNKYPFIHQIIEDKRIEILAYLSNTRINQESFLDYITFDHDEEKLYKLYRFFQLHHPSMGSKMVNILKVTLNVFYVKEFVKGHPKVRVIINLLKIEDKDTFLKKIKKLLDFDISLEEMKRFGINDDDLSYASSKIKKDIVSKLDPFFIPVLSNIVSEYICS